MSTTLKNIKIPYPTEGVIRSAQLNDTVCPENSVQLAVNMNFDRVGALQTRPGVETYATSLTGKIQNFGTLNNSIIPPGYESLSKMALTNDFDSSSPVYGISSIKYDDTHILAAWKGTDDDGFAQILTVNSTTGSLTPVGSPFEFDVADADFTNLQKIDSTHFLCIYSSTSLVGKAVILAVNSSTFAVTAPAATFTFDATNVLELTSALIDANHVIIFYTGGAGFTGQSIVLEINLGTWVVTAPGAIFNFELSTTNTNSCSAIGDGIHFINFWTGAGADGFTQVFTVNTGTWNITAVGTALDFDTNIADYNSCSSLEDGEHFINFWKGQNGDGFCRVFAVNPGTFAVTAAGALLEFDTVSASYNRSITTGDGEHFINSWVNGTEGFIQLFEVNLTSFDIIKKHSPISLGDSNEYIPIVMLTTYKAVGLWGTSTAGVGSVFTLEGFPIYNDILFAQQGNADVYSWDGANWTLRRSGLSNNSKARFTQYLNYLWMVNGNGYIGDNIATSNGGNFGTDLVPVGFPPGDFIQAGFEGRVWVIDATSDAIYYTDIVQFTPPNTYTLTYNAATNFLKNFASQDGQKMTGMIQVPRALLIFKEDSIYRIYGAASVDNYPAYNVGTYSQESIVKTKDSIYFHHSSGFYKFDYGGQPIEISRRIIDFVKAIPRDNYEDVVGIWDGFDAVKWTIGSVTVEGVTYPNCQVRYTISTQVWTIYDYTDNVITAMIRFDDGTTINQIMGTIVGVVGKLDSGNTDFTKSIYYEQIDRWRSFTEMYSKSKSISGVMLSSENGAGTLLQYQTEKSTPNEWHDIDTVRNEYNALFPNANTDDFNTLRFRFRGNTSGTPMIFHGIEILSIQDKGLDEN
jgi:hypothetical protein